MTRRLVKRFRVLDSDINGPFAIAAVCVTMFMLAYTGNFGKPSVLCFYAIWFSILFANPQTAIAAPQRVLPLLILPAFATFSFLWSTESALSLRHGIQFGTTVLAAIVAARIVSLANMTKALLLSTIVIILYSLYEGEYSYDVIDGSYTFTGAFESKNSLGFMAALSMIPAVCILLSRDHRRYWVFLAVSSIPLALYTLWISQSATAIIITGAAVLTAILIAGVRSFSPMARRVILVLIVFALGVGIYWLWSTGFFDKFLAILGKDATLTGRTYLWSEALRLGGENPAFGLGFKSFWVHGQPDAERLWHEFYIRDRRGFHFHNTMLQTYVALGLAGVVLVVAIKVMTLYLVIRGVLGRMTAEHVTLFGAISIAVLTRSLVEVDFVNEYSVSTFLLTYFLIAAMDEQALAKQRLREFALSQAHMSKRSSRHAFDQSGLVIE